MAKVWLFVSAVIMDDAGEQRGYDRVLERVSKPLMQAMREHVEFTPTQTTRPDGAVSNLVSHSAKQAMPLWRYPDLTTQ